MALIGTVRGVGGTTIPDLYIRIANANVSKDNEGYWILTYAVEAFLSEDKAGQSAHLVPTEEVNLFHAKYNTEITNPFALAYADLKTRTIKTPDDPIHNVITDITDA
tara:strand:+ start:452 stop:772 length:321 start_codon:yes stop_codon:yes gene_type:complete